MALIRTSHPRLSVALALVVALLAALMGRPFREVAVAAGAVLLTQAILGLVNDLVDQDRDAKVHHPGKPLAQGFLHRGTVTFFVVVLLLLAIPMSLQNGTAAGLFVLATLPVGYLHNRWLKSTPLSFVGWSVTFALLVAFLTYGGWGTGQHGSAPTVAALVAAAVLGLAVHLATSLRDLKGDHTAGIRSLPVRLGLLLGAPRLLVITAILTLIAVVAFGWVALQIGLAR